jgi:hypothetical protein
MRIVRRKFKNTHIFDVLLIDKKIRDLFGCALSRVIQHDGDSMYT